MSITEVDKPIRRKVGGMVITIERDGISFRGHGCRKKVKASWGALVKAALEGDFCLSAKEWRDPVGTLRRLASLEQRGHRK